MPGLGDAFVDEVEAGIGVILNGPAVWRLIEDDVRRYLIQRCSRPLPSDLFAENRSGVLNSES